MSHPPPAKPRRRVLLALVTIAVAMIGVTLTARASASAETGRNDDARAKPTVVLVHGAWADGSSWNKVAARLLSNGYDVRVPPNNLRGVASDAAELAGYVGTIPGAVVLVGHSYGGMVITNAATTLSNVRALVFVDALIPAQGDTLVGMTHAPSIFAQDPANVLDFAPYSGAQAADLDTYVKPSIYGEAFADRSFDRREIAVLAARQRPLSTRVFDEPSGAPAWATLPSWAIVGERDRIIPTDDQLSMARRAGARIVRVDAPHLAMVTDDRIVADVIVRAANHR